MKNAWKIILTIVLSAILLGAVCVLVGSITGADFARIFSVFDTQYKITEYITWFNQVVATVTEALA